MVSLFSIGKSGVLYLHQLSSKSSRNNHFVLDRAGCFKFDFIEILTGLTGFCDSHFLSPFVEALLSRWGATVTMFLIG